MNDTLALELRPANYPHQETGTFHFVVEGRIVGHALMATFGFGAWYVANLAQFFINEDERGQGYARMALAALQARFPDGIALYAKGTLPEGLYAKMGFVVVNPKRHRWPDHRKGCGHCMYWAGRPVTMADWDDGEDLANSHTEPRALPVEQWTQGGVQG